MFVLHCTVRRSSDGLVLTVASSDGYCSLIGFEPGELGQPLQSDKLPACMRHTSSSSPSSSPLSSSSSPLAPSSTIPQTQKKSTSPPISDIKPRRIHPIPVQSNISRSAENTSLEEPLSSVPLQSQTGKAKETNTERKPRRVQLIQLDADLNTAGRTGIGSSSSSSSSLQQQSVAMGSVATFSQLPAPSPRRIKLTPLETPDSHLQEQERNGQGHCSLEPLQGPPLSNSGAVQQDTSSPPPPLGEKKTPRRVPFVTLSPFANGGLGTSSPSSKAGCGGGGVTRGTGTSDEPMEVE